MADLMGLVKALKDKAVEQYGKGAPYRDALASALRGDTKGINQALSKSDLTPADIATSFAPLGITAWHGSPHTFEKFDLSKIGTGEGAQSYGHGLYFAESPKVAETYKSTGDSGLLINGKSLAERKSFMKLPEEKKASINELINVYLQHHNGDLQKVKNDLFRDAAYKTFEGADEAYKLVRDAKSIGNVQGNLYKVDIADETIPKMLDWDKPLAEQHPDVLNAINQLGDRFRPLDEIEAKNVTGERLYRRIENSLGSNFGEQANPMASKMLQDIGISGIRYLDRSSRGAGQGTSNYVVFDPNTVKILERK